MKNQKKKILIILTAILSLFFVVLLFIGNYLVNFAIVRTDGYTDVAPASIVSEEDANIIAQNRNSMNMETKLWQEEVTSEEISITSEDGLTLIAEVYPAKEESHKWLLGIHGYKSSNDSYLDTGCRYAQQGFNVLLPDMRSHGESEGTYIGMGWLEKDDVLKWLSYIIERDPQAEIIVQGTSMGGATAMMLSGEALPKQVKGIIEDCGYTSVWDIFADELEYLFNLPSFPILYAAEFVGNIRADYNFREASSLEQVKKATVPMLFIHGSEDNFVRADMVYDVYEACPATKDLLIIEGAGHAESQYLDPQLYYDTIFSFIDKNCIK